MIAFDDPLIGFDGAAVALFDDSRGFDDIDWAFDGFGPVATGYTPPFHSTAFTVRPQDSQLVSVGTSRLVVADHRSVLAVRSHLSTDLKAD